MSFATVEDVRQSLGYTPDVLLADISWKDYMPSPFTPEDKVRWSIERRLEEAAAEAEQLALAFWWDLEGVRCATFGQDPNCNPYRS